ncbi:MAG: adenylate/guanylate cyclase domain-containing protein [Phycisphaerales bacterium]|nr:MAG: adenylate/guanylate cyclase domain-containing protein [Phycisphaerales bacterium]
MEPADNLPQSYLYTRLALSRRARLLIWLLTPLPIAACCAALTLTGWLDAFERLSIDARFQARGPLQPDPRIVIVEIGEHDRRELGGTEVRFDLRAWLDDAVRKLADAGAVCIALDVWLPGRGDPEIDAALAAELAETTTVLGIAYSEGYKVRAAAPFRQTDSPEGTLVVEPDPDGVLRRLPRRAYLDEAVGDGQFSRIPHFPFIVAWFALAEESRQQGQEPPLLDVSDPTQAVVAGRVVRYGRLINFVAGPGQGFKALSLTEAVRGDFPSGSIDGAVVLIGEVRSVLDQFRLPLTVDLAPGVYYHANVVDQILSDRSLVEWPDEPLPSAVLVFVLAATAGFYFWFLRDWWARPAGWLWMSVYFGAGAVVFLGGWWLVAKRAFDDDVVVPLAAPLATVGVVLVSGLALQLSVSTVNARRLAQRSRQIESLFGRAVSPQVLEAIKADPTRVARTEVREITVLFCDIRGFTTASAALEPEHVAAMLNEYFETITSAVFEQDGFVDKFVGDELMAVFNVPIAQSDHAVRAAHTALSIKRRLADLNAKRAARGQKELDCGIGIHSGPAAVGHIGSERRANYTVVGETVNVAARIEELTRRGEILLSSEVAVKVDASLALREWQTVTLRGIGRPVQLFELMPA